MFPLHRIVGVELSKALLDTAVANVQRMKHRKAHEVDLRLGDAAKFKLPDDVNVVYFFNPFAGDSYIRLSTPRKIYVIYFNNDHFDKIVGGQLWIKKYVRRNFIREFPAASMRQRFSKQTRGAT